MPLNINTTTPLPNIPLASSSSSKSDDALGLSFSHSEKFKAPISATSSKVKPPFVDKLLNPSKDVSAPLAITIPPLEVDPPVQPSSNNRQTPKQLGPAGWIRKKTGFNPESVSSQYTTELETILGRPLSDGEKTLVKKSAMLNTSGMTFKGLEKLLKAMGVDAERETVPVTQSLLDRLNNAHRVTVTVESKPPKTYVFTRQSNGAWAKLDTSTGKTTMAETPADFVASRQISQITMLTFGKRETLHISIPDVKAPLPPPVPNKTDDATGPADDWHKKCAKLIEEGEALQEEKKLKEAKARFEAALKDIDKSQSAGPLLKCRALHNLSECLPPDDPARADTCKKIVDILKPLVDNPPAAYTAHSIQEGLANTYHDLGDAYAARIGKENPSREMAQQAKGYYEEAVNLRKSLGSDASISTRQANALSALLDARRVLGEQDLTDMQMDLAQLRGDLALTDNKPKVAIAEYQKIVEETKDGDAADVARTIAALDGMRLAHLKTGDSDKFLQTSLEQIEVLEGALGKSDIQANSKLACLENLAQVNYALGCQIFDNRSATKITNLSDVETYFDAAIDARRKGGEPLQCTPEHIYVLENRLALYTDTTSSGSQGNDKRAQLERELSEAQAKVYPEEIKLDLAAATHALTGFDKLNEHEKEASKEIAETYVRSAIMKEGKLESQPAAYAQALKLRAAYTSDVVGDKELAKSLLQQAAEAEKKANGSPSS